MYSNRKSGPQNTFTEWVSLGGFKSPVLLGLLFILLASCLVLLAQLSWFRVYPTAT